MKKIRINELARELEVKPGAILELLPELGVTEKKTHSSSIDEDVSLEIRRRLTGESGAGARPSEEPPAREVREHAEEPGAAPQPAPEPPKAQTHTVIPVSPVSPPPAAAHAEPATEAHASPHAPRPVPFRAPLAGAGRTAVPPLPAVPAIPIPTKVKTPHHAQAPPEAAPPAVMKAPATVAHRAPEAAAPPPAAPRAPGAPVAKAPQAPAPARPAPAKAPAEAPVKAKAAEPAVIENGAPAAAAPPAASRPAAPARNVPLVQRPAAPAGPRPGQILSGPRAPLPGGEAPRPPVVVPGLPKPPVIQQPRPQPAAPRIQPAQPGAAPQTGRAAVSGQPAARPVVPPRPEILARLQQSQAKAAPGQPAAPRPGMPTPGRPLFPGSPRAGQPAARTGAGPGGRPLRGRGPHPTAPVLEPPSPVTEAGRRETAKKRGAQRVREIEEGKLRPISLKREPAALPVVNKEITISEGITVKEFSEKLGVKASLVIKALLDKKIFATINQTLDTRMVEELARDFGATTAKMSYEEEAVQEIEQSEAAGDLETRPPIVTVMGHVDHGKTSLLDAIRKANVADKEAGGITQHIGAYHVEINGRKIVFIDTPGHEAFTRMRSRGAKVTDIVVLVVAADDGVMPQTREAIDHARAAEVPIIVAINKIDKPDAQPERVKQQLSDLGLMPEDWGGDTPFVPVSAKMGQNIDLLLEMVLLVADMQELKANRARPAIATVLEAQLDRGRGPVATLLIRNGTLRVGDYFLCGSVFGRVRALYDDRGNPIKEAEPSMPVELLGLESMPEVGDTLQAVTDLAKARQIAEFREQKAREIAMAKTRITLEQLHAQLREGETKELNLIIKADVGGTAEVISDTLQKLSTEKISIRVLHAGVGAITENDVNLAMTSDAIIIGFNVRPERKAAELAEQEKVDIRLHTIIYELTDEIKKAMAGMLEPVFREAYKGRAEVRETFRISKVGTVAGCYVQDGVIPRDAQVRLLRDNVVVFTGRLDSLKRFKNDASEVKSGFECGIALAGFNDLKPGDIIEAFVREQVSQEALV
jgi:translation initiation factor IF-2